MKPDGNGRLSIEEKIRTAQDLFSKWGMILVKDSRISDLLSSLRRNIISSQEAMNRVGVIAACRSCEQEEGGSCCGHGIENKYTPILLLINLLMGQVFPMQRSMDNSCYFLTQSGCYLQARHVICVNYLCSKIYERVQLSGLIHLQEVNGQELHTLFIIHETIKRLLTDEHQPILPG
jgi:hypothetical protein